MEPQMAIGVVGAGGVGKCFLKQLDALIATRGTSAAFYLCYLANSTRAVYNDDHAPVSREAWVDGRPAATGAGRTPLGFGDMVDYLGRAPGGRAVLVDNTSNQTLAEHYPRFLAAGVNIVTPNKKAFSDTYSLWQEMQMAARSSRASVLHESTVGAGLPVISTLRDLIDTGDKVTRIEGVFSGTMSFLFNSFAPAGATGSGKRWSAAVEEARALGYTEPDPRDDLNGLDVARKLTILARIAGLPVRSPTSFEVQSLIPEELASCASAADFMRDLPRFDDAMEEHKSRAAREGKLVRFVGKIDLAKQEVSVGVGEFDKTHPVVALQGSDNMVSFYTERYGKNPLIIQGAGAGPEVTAMGVTADLLKILRQKGCETG